MRAEERKVANHTLSPRRRSVCASSSSWSSGGGRALCGLCVEGHRIGRERLAAGWRLRQRYIAHGPALQARVACGEGARTGVSSSSANVHADPKA
jgi:hypothetical protein